MDPKDLLKLLDLDRKPPDASPTPPITTPIESIPTDDTSPTALVVDEWGLRRGRDLVADNERLQHARTDALAAADFFCAAFDPDPKLHASCIDPRRYQFVSQLLETPDYHALHTATQFDDTASEIAATHFAEQFAQLQQEDTKEPKNREVISASHAADPELATLRAVGQAITAAEKEVNELHEATAALGLGSGMPGSNDARAIAALFQRVRSDPGLRRICELAGRFRRVAQSKQRWKVTHGLDDVVGVESGGEVSRLLPLELARLTVPILEHDTLRRIVERQALCREHHATEPVGKGPIIVAIDESGSMRGDKAHMAKALGLALAGIARQQKRWCALCAYSGDSGERLLALPPGRWDELKLAEWLSAFIGKGSDIDVPVREMPRIYAALKAPIGRTDVIFITDAQCRLPTDVIQHFLNWKQSAQARLITLVIDSSPGDLAVISDELHQVPSLSAESDAIGRVLSL